MCNVNEADIFIGYLKPNRNMTHCLCKTCSAKLGVPSDLLVNQVEYDSENQVNDNLINHDVKCPHCHTEIRQFLSTGQTGCPHCYLVFKKEIDQFFRVGSQNTVGNIKLTNLSLELENALVNENYEYAATLRDRIKVLSYGEVNEFVEN